MEKIVMIAFITGLIVFFLPRRAGAAFPRLDNVAAADLDTLARTLWGEARGEGYTGMQAVANVIMNRYAAAQRSTARAQQFGYTVAQICRKPKQFSAWNANDPNFSKMLDVTAADPQFQTALHVAEKALRGNLPDITGGADHYHAVYVAPSWSQGVNPTTRVGPHVFFNLA